MYLSKKVIPVLFKFQKMKNLIVSVEGNVGSGKSSLLNYFQQFSSVVETIQEPVETWRNVGGHNMLKLFYENQEKYAFAFQSLVQLTRLDIHTRSSTTPVKMIERSLQNNRYCFVENSHKNKAIGDVEYNLLSTWYDWMEDHMNIKLDLIVYLRSSPEVAMKRIYQRGRPEEQTIPMTYIQQIHDVYEKWLVEGQAKLPLPPVVTLDANLPHEEIISEYERCKKFIIEMVNCSHSV
ncbi:deoxynucleoside kinase-like isoform X3 [Artemia franciscana]|uniref:Deoxynucleoside kinase domain-containing protein n=3 Tax=Artemia franciscana TaxID=6661 RepID=A0AA88KTF4_ARTSF|nr:hypothetical protein QYM36_019383 [Artemia franciscana]